VELHLVIAVGAVVGLSQSLASELFIFPVFSSAVTEVAVVDTLVAS